MNRADVVYRFGPFELQPRERRLLCEGKSVPLPGKAFDLLVCLVARAPRLVRKDELLSVVWPDTIVEETNLNYTISLIRKALDGHGDQRYIETVPRQGYRFVADIEGGGGDEPRTTSTADELTGRRFPLVQRESEIAALGTALARARAGQRQIVFITGEA